jgi:hypothetical protein
MPLAPLARSRRLDANRKIGKQKKKEKENEKENISTAEPFPFFLSSLALDPSL